MTQEEWDNLEKAISRLSTPEKHELIRRLNSALKENDQASTTPPEPSSHQALTTFIENMESMPLHEDPHEKLGNSNKSHDQILYDME